MLSVARMGTSEGHVEIPIHRVMDRNARCSPAEISHFFRNVWDEAIQEFARGGITFAITDQSGEVLKHPSGKPRFKCLQRDAINVILTDRVPLDWDKGRSLAGVAVVYEGYCLCVISMREAHGNQIPFVGTNTVIHELLHILLQDVFIARTDLTHGQSREARADYYATKLWLFGSADFIRQEARSCLRRLPQANNKSSDLDGCPAAAKS